MVALLVSYWNSHSTTAVWQIIILYFYIEENLEEQCTVSQASCWFFHLTIRNSLKHQVIARQVLHFRCSKLAPSTARNLFNCGVLWKLSFELTFMPESYRSLVSRSFKTTRLSSKWHLPKGHHFLPTLHHTRLLQQSVKLCLNFRFSILFLIYLFFFPAYLL